MKWQWCTVRLQWQSYDEETEQWYDDNPPLPDWFIKAQGVITVAQFITIWQQASNLNEVKKELYWLSIEEIEEWSQFVREELERLSIQSLQDLELIRESLLSVEEVERLVTAGLLNKEEYYEIPSDVYDPAKALLEAQSKREKEDRPHVQTMEVGGRYRFRAKH
jgi:hypothetical protein